MSKNLRPSLPILLVLSIALNLVQFVSSRSVRQKGPLSAGVLVRTFTGHEFVSTTEQSLTLQDIERQFCREIETPHIIVYPQLARLESGVCESYHELKWNKPLRPEFWEELKPGDEVHVLNKFPLKNRSTTSRVTDLTSKQGGGHLYTREFGGFRFGTLLFKDEQRYPDATESYGRFVVLVSEKEKADVISFLDSIAVAQANDKSGTGSGIRSSLTSTPVSVLSWTWEPGTTLYQLTAGNDYLDIYISSESSLIYYIEDHC